MTETNLYAIPLTTIAGEATTLEPWRGKVLLIVNTASKCGLTPQYEALQALHERLSPRGFAVLGFPANDFAGQEPGSNAEIAAFCDTRFKVSFPLFGKIVVTGPERHPLYNALVTARPDATTVTGVDFRAQLRTYGITPTELPEVAWNFEKFLIDRTGTVAGRFAPDTPPDAPVLVDEIDRLLA